MNLAQISSSFIFITTITILTAEELYHCSSCLPNYVIPMHYRIKLSFEKYDFNLENKYGFNFYGESNITNNNNILQTTKYLKLHILNLIITQRKTTLIKNNIIYAVKKSSERDLLSFLFSNVLSPGLYTLTMEFSGRFTKNSAKDFFKSSYTNKENGIT